MTAKSLSVFLVDDELLARERLKRLLDGSAFEVLGEAENGEQAIAAIQASCPDIVLLDIRMPGIDGLQVAQALCRMKPAPAIIFCTAYDDYAIEAFRLNATSYLLKPARKEELFAALKAATQLSQAQLSQLQTDDSSANTSDELDEHIIAQTWQGQERISLRDIFYFRADQKYVSIIHRHGETLTDHSLKEIHKRFDGSLFRAHRNALVNIKHIHALTRDKDSHYHFELSNGAQIDVSRRLVSDAKDLMNHL